ncbi:uncharacterized protein K441DRAFT_623398 [Cenococcum geophilum 1.58]|uniref:Uncharacterized protein n=1 Tax=Cenococcum geophilum 1.58 TaxID=794803 RepID=A0ACC8EM13_9PEZI|nr:hypothetical protein K441DRAFT_623398 [Cenococcum geophilum 1.58]
MATSSVSIPRFLLPRANYLLRPRTRLLPPTSNPHSALVRHASNSQPSSKPPVLEKPAKFNPPSHGARLPRKKPRNYGPAPTEQQKHEMKTKKYPNMMPPEGSFMHWFLTNRWLHTWISLSTLFSLAFTAFAINFTQTTPYGDLLPSRSDFLSHPFASTSKFIEVYKMHTVYISAQTAERRKKKVEDVQKRAEYRKAHGLDKEEGFGGWMARKDEEVLGPGLRAADRVVNEGGSAGEGEAADSGVYTDFEGRRKPVKKWLGIW